MLALFAGTAVVVAAGSGETEDVEPSAGGLPRWHGLASRPEERWTVAVDGDVDDAILADDVYVSFARADGEAVVRIDADTGDEMWRTPLGAGVAEATLDRRGDEIAALTVDEGGATTVRVLSATDGTVQDEFDLEGPYTFEFRQFVPGLLAGGGGFAVMDGRRIVEQVTGGVIGLTTEHLILVDEGRVHGYDRGTLAEFGEPVTVGGGDVAGTIAGDLLLVASAADVSAHSRAGDRLWTIDSGVGEVFGIAGAGPHRVLVAGVEGSSLVDVATDHGEVLWSSGVEGAAIEDVLEVDGQWYAVTSRTSESGAATTIDVVALDDSGPHVDSTFDAETGPDFAAAVTHEAVYVLTQVGNASILEAAALPDLTDRWTLSVGDETRQGHWVQLDGALLGVAHDAEESAITFFR